MTVAEIPVAGNPVCTEMEVNMPLLMTCDMEVMVSSSCPKIYNGVFNFELDRSHIIRAVLHI